MKKYQSILLLLIMLATLVPAHGVQAQSTIEVDIQPDGDSMKDTILVKEAPGFNAGGLDLLNVGEQSGELWTTRALLEFDLSGLPRDLSMTSATLTLTVKADQASNGGTMYVYAVNQDWGEYSTNWDWRYNTQHLWAEPGAMGEGDILPDYIGSVTLGAEVAVDTEVVITLDPGTVEAMVKENLFGFLLMMENENDDLYQFYSSDSTAETKRPMLTLEYVPDSTDPVDPGWECVNVSVYTRCLENELGVIISPFQKAGPADGPVGYSKPSVYAMPTVAAKLNCDPYPRCLNDYPIYYRFEYTVAWSASGSTEGQINMVLDIPGGTETVRTAPCGIGTTAECMGFFEGTINVNDLPVNYDAGYTIGLRAGMSFPSWWFVNDPSIGWTLYLSLEPFDENCADLYYVPVPDTYVIDPTLETPLGMEGVPPDDQIYPTVTGQIYMAQVANTWNNGRTDAAVSYDGETWMSWAEFTVNALCVDVLPENQDNPDYWTVYFEAPSETFHIRVNDEADEFADNINDVPAYEYTIGIAFELAQAVVCETQYTYDTLNDWVASVQVISTMDDVLAVGPETAEEPLEAGAWYAIEVASGTWNEPGGEERIDMEFQFEIMNDEWLDLAEGSEMVYCVSSDGKTVFIQAPMANELHLRVNDNDENFGNNTGTLGVNIYKAAFERTITGCELEYEIGDLVSSDTVDGGAQNGKIFAVSLATDGIELGYGLEPGGVYMLETTGGPWYLTWDSPTSEWEFDKQYYDMQTKVGESGEWDTLEQFPLQICVVEIDALGHQRMYFKAPETGGNTYHIRIAGATMFTKGTMGWNLYQAIDLNIGGANSCTDFSYDPNNANGFGTIDSTRAGGVDIIGLETWSYFAIQIESANEESDPPYYQKSGWYETSGGDERDDLELSLDGGTWSDLPNAPGVLCYFYTPETDELVFFVRVLHNQTWKLRANSEDFSDNEGLEFYRVFEATSDNDPWVSCIDDYTPTVPALNEHEWIPPQDEEGVNLQPTLTYVPGDDDNDDGIIKHGDVYLEAGHHYMVETREGPWRNGDDEDPRYSAQLSSDGGATWYAMQEHPDVICSNQDQLKHHWKVIFEVTDGQRWKIRVDDTDTEVWTDNTGNLAYRLNLVNEFADNPGDYGDDYDPEMYDVCLQKLVRPQALELSEIGSLGNYFGDWIRYFNRSILSYFAWCPRHTDLLIDALDALKKKEPLATLEELDTMAENVMAEIDSYDWEGGYDDDSIFTTDGNQLAEELLPQGGVASDPWNGGDLVTFNSGMGLPSYYYTCQNVFADYLPQRLQQATCFVSAYWQETGASKWVQLSLDLSALGVLFVMIKGSLQSLIYMMTGVRPWTKDGAIKLAGNIAEGDAFRDGQIARTLESIERQNEERNRRSR